MSTGRWYTTTQELERALDLYFHKAGGVDEWQRARDAAKGEAVAIRASDRAEAAAADTGPSVSGFLIVGALVGLIIGSVFVVLRD